MDGKIGVSGPEYQCDDNKSRRQILPKVSPILTDLLMGIIPLYTMIDLHMHSTMICLPSVL
jgi:hypothetical protein